MHIRPEHLVYLRLQITDVDTQQRRMAYAVARRLAGEDVFGEDAQHGYRRKLATETRLRRVIEDDLRPYLSAEDVDDALTYLIPAIVPDQL